MSFSTFVMWVLVLMAALSNQTYSPVCAFLLKGLLLHAHRGRVCVHVESSSYWIDSLPKQSLPGVGDCGKTHVVVHFPDTEGSFGVRTRKLSKVTAKRYRTCKISADFCKCACVCVCVCVCARQSKWHEHTRSLFMHICIRLHQCVTVCDVFSRTVCRV